ncbi:MLP-like protein 34 [Arachis ipaensis]|uniref:MLP-like protein 34 n=1 Tax=Arachis ipaensis TaxID=130454 RepID=UPI000A2B150B|nr:MLP-like protein 34 [Arachis ipaensis]
MTTSQVQKIETEFSIKADAKEFYDVFCNKTHQVAKAWPDIVQSVVIHEGGWGTERSIISWNYVYVLLHAVPKKDGGSMVHWTMEYEKINDNTSDPHTLMELVVDESKQEKKGLGAHVLVSKYVVQLAEVTSNNLRMRNARGQQIDYHYIQDERLQVFKTKNFQQLNEPNSFTIRHDIWL